LLIRDDYKQNSNKASVSHVSVTSYTPQYHNRHPYLGKRFNISDTQEGMFLLEYGENLCSCVYVCACVL